MPNHAIPYLPLHYSHHVTSYYIGLQVTSLHCIATFQYITLNHIASHMALHCSTLYTWKYYIHENTLQHLIHLTSHHICLWWHIYIICGFFGVLHNEAIVMSHAVFSTAFQLHLLPRQCSFPRTRNQKSSTNLATTWITTSGLHGVLVDWSHDMNVVYANEVSSLK